ncbi:hypothetical protein Trydic_g11126 [Trypoxylus dichotomus]
MEWQSNKDIRKMKVILCLALGLILVVAEDAELRVPEERTFVLEVSLIRSNLRDPEHGNQLVTLLRQAWLSNNDLSGRIRRFAEAATTYLDKIYIGYHWSAVANEEAMYHPAQFSARFRVRYLLRTYMITLFSRL